MEAKVSVAYGQHEVVTLTKDSHPVKIPDHPYARLSYYLNSVQYVLGENFGKLADFEHYRRLTLEERYQLISYCRQYHPPVLMKASLFFLVSDKFDRRYVNDFYLKTSEELQYLIASGEIKDSNFLHSEQTTLFDKKISSNKIFIGDKYWFEKNYDEPMRFISDYSNIDMDSRKHDNCRDIFCCETTKCDCDVCDPVNCAHCSCCCTDLYYNKKLDCDSVAWLIICMYMIPPFSCLFSVIGCCASKSQTRCYAIYTAIFNFILWTAVLYLIFFL